MINDSLRIFIWLLFGTAVSWLGETRSPPANHSEAQQFAKIILIRR